MPGRLAIVSTSYPAHSGDASGHFVASEARALVALGHDVTVITGGTASESAGNPRVVRLDDGGVTGWPGVLPRLRANKLRALGLARWIAKARAELGRRGPFERVIAHWIVPAGLPVAALSTLRGAALEVVVHGSDARLLARVPRPLARAVVALLTRRDARFRCVSPELGRLLEDLGASARHPITVAPAPVEVSHRERNDVRRALGLRADARLALVVGRLIPTKRVRDALMAAELVSNLEIVTLGDGPELAALRTEFEQVRFLGRVDRERALDWIAAADLVLSASREEGSSTVVREARALGVPVVAVCSGDLAELAHSDAGVFVVR